MRNGQFFAWHVMQRATWQLVGSGVNPMTAVTDLDGAKMELSVAVRPMRLGASSWVRKGFCRVRGKSPYPGL